ncbi:hypothetical protein CTEN210_18240 [Chaetoceros tenuissimus]|uniref:Kinesin light chain n=1 Tax=Chaetoceros tenuissimus TaxID=426638 RepID=A0AAD3DC66_9STRA|nr:hypothetical protein CTEN210_18240 [Chaetoceros tenuissimus]
MEHPEPEWWLRTFSDEVVEKLNHTVMVMPQWNDPTFFAGIPQLYAGLHTYETTGAKFEIAMTDDEFRSFLNECKNNYSKVIRKMLNFYDLQNNEEVKELEAAHDVFIENTLASKYLQLSELIRDWIENIGRPELEKVEHNSKDEMDLMSMLGSICMEKKQFDEAESFFRESSSMREEFLGEFHFDTLRSINDLASVYCRLGLYGKAEIIYEANLCRCQQCLESGNPLLLETMSNLGAVYRNQNKTEMAEPLFQDCLLVCEKYLEPGHPKTLMSLLNLARLQGSRGNHKDAGILFEDCLAKCEKHLGSDHAITRSCKARLTLNEKCLKDSHVMTLDEIEIANLLEKVNENGLNCRGSLEAQISLVLHIQEQDLLNMAYCLCASCLLRSELLLVRHDPLAIIIVVAVMASL